MSSGTPAESNVLRVMTYNVHSCIGLDRKLSLERIADVIASAAPDIVALQELDVGRARTRGHDQAHAIAELLGMGKHFHPAVRVEEEQYGDAVLSPWPTELVRAQALPGLKGLPARLSPEARGALWVEVDWAGTTVQCINTHLGLIAKERWQQVSALMGNDWLGGALPRGPTLLCGDLNANPRSRVCRQLSEVMHDAQLSLEGHRPRRTFRSSIPVLRIDHVYASDDFVARRVDVLNDATAQVASDHLPLVVDLELRTR